MIPYAPIVWDKNNRGTEGFVNRTQRLYKGRLGLRWIRVA